MATLEWRKNGETRPVIAKTSLSAGKSLQLSFFTGTKYLKLLDSAKAAYRNKRRNQPICLALSYNNARPHTPALAQDKLDQIHWDILEHPSYSPDLSSCNFHVFGPLKEGLGGHRF